MTDSLQPAGHRYVLRQPAAATAKPSAFIRRVLPERVRLLDVTIPVATADLPPQLRGQYDPSPPRIIIDSGLAARNPSAAHRTLWHEVAHAIDDLARLNLTHDGVNALGLALATLYIDLPDVGPVPFPLSH